MDRKADVAKYESDVQFHLAGDGVYDTDPCHILELGTRDSEVECIGDGPRVEKGEIIAKTKLL